MKVFLNLLLSVPYFTGFVMLQKIETLTCWVKWPFSPLFYGIRDVTRTWQNRSRKPWTFSPLFYGIRDVTAFGRLWNWTLESLSVPYFTGFVMLLLHNAKCCQVAVQLSVPYFTGFVMLLRREHLRRLNFCDFQSPILRDSWCYLGGAGNFPGIEYSFQSPILRDSWCYASGDQDQAPRQKLSVPYFTGFVMLPSCKDSEISCRASFSPLFYGIRDVTILPALSITSSAVLSVPYFTGFVMLPGPDRYTFYQEHALSVPYFTGFVMLPCRG